MASSIVKRQTLSLAFLYIIVGAGYFAVANYASSIQIQLPPIYGIFALLFVAAGIITVITKKHSLLYLTGIFLAAVFLIDQILKAIEGWEWYSAYTLTLACLWTLAIVISLILPKNKDQAIAIDKSAKQLASLPEFKKSPESEAVHE